MRDAHGTKDAARHPEHAASLKCALKGHPKPSAITLMVFYTVWKRAKARERKDKHFHGVKPELMT